MKFYKMQGLGNDYIYFDCLQENIIFTQEQIIRLSNRNFGIGSDGIVLIKTSEVADYKMEMFNSDGTQAEMCGNAIRCVYKYLYDKKITQKKEITIETLAGIQFLKLNLINNEIDTVEVEIDIKEVKPLTVTVDNKEISGMFVSVGNPHFIIEVSDVDNMNIEEIGKKIEYNEAFSNRTNVEFVEIIDRSNVKLRVWERGAGETMACGTGATATIVALHNINKTENTSNVQLKGGNLKIQVQDAKAKMIGKAEFVFEGEINL